MNRTLAILIAASCLAAPVALAKEVAPTPQHSFGHKVLFYVPNRFLDVVDLLRARLRGGPGLAFGLRATDYASIFAGSYNTYYLGLPGPRYPHRWRSPIGKEKYRGISVGKVDATDENPWEPDYTPTEFDLSLQLLILGVDLGTDPVEWWDLLAGVLTFDPRGDDL